jgi:hypothetical protein
MNRGIVMEMDAAEIIVMTAEGRFAKVPIDQRNCQIGEEILFTEVKPKTRNSWITVGSFIAVAAAVLLLLFNLNPGSTVVANKKIVAYVSIDINPSVEMGIDENNIVLEIRGLNADGKELIKNIIYTGKHIDLLTEDLLQEAEMKYLSKGEGDIIISSTMGENGNVDSKVNDVVLITKLKEVVVQHINKSHPEQKANYQITAFAADKEVRKAAESKGLSAGKYTIYLNAKDKGQDTTIEDLKKESVHAIAKKAGGIDKLIDTEDLSKDKTSKLLKEDESGDLDRKLNELKKAKKNEDNKNEQKLNEDKKNKDKKNEDNKSEDKNNGNNKSENGKNEDNKNDENKQSISDLFNRETVKPIDIINSVTDVRNSDEKAGKINWGFNRKPRSKPPDLIPTPTPTLIQDDNVKKNEDKKNEDKKNNDKKNEDKKNEDKGKQKNKSGE